GRDPQCHLRPASPMISKRHCALLVRADKVFVRDFDSTNGTFLNDQPVKGEVEVNHQDRLKVGPLAFTVQIEGPVAVNKPTPVPPPAATAPAPTGDDDSIAAMLLSLQDDGSPSAPGAPAADGVPQGSTVLDVMSPLAQEGAPAEDGKKEDPKKKDKAK